MKPTHSVIMPVLNGDKFIAEALGSALVQLAQDDEIIVIDNGSTDDTIALVERYPDQRVRLIHEAKPGPAAARNAGLREVRGIFVSMLDCDDLWPAGRLAALMPLLEADESYDAALGRLRVRFDAGVDPDYVKMDGAIADALLLGTLVFRRSFLERLEPFDETLTFAEDSDYLLRARQLGIRLATVEDDVLLYRRHETNMTRNRVDSTRGTFMALARHIARQRNAK